MALPMRLYGCQRGVSEVNSRIPKPQCQVFGLWVPAVIISNSSFLPRLVFPGLRASRGSRGSRGIASEGSQPVDEGAHIDALVRQNRCVGIQVFNQGICSGTAYWGFHNLFLFA